MSSHPNRQSFSFVKLKELDKRDEGYDAIIQTLFDENGLCRKRLPKGANSLGRAISDALFFTPNRQEEIHQDLLKHLTQLVASNELTARLNGFQGNSMMLNDFANNPQLPGFEKTTLELVSLFYKVKVVLYTMNEDHYLSATIFNNNYTKTVEILRAKANHYEAVFSKARMEKATECQNLVLNLIDKIGSNSPSNTIRNLNNNEFINFAYENAQTSALSPKDKDNDNFRITRGVHKKSLSDNFNTNFDIMEEQQNKFFDAFMKGGVSDDIFKNVTLRKDTAESGFSINANFDFIDEQNFDGPSFQNNGFAIKNYPMPRGRISPRAIDNNLEMHSPIPTFSKAKFSNHPNVLFNENLSLAEMDRIERSINTATTQDHGASPFYNAMSPPGLTPTKFNQRGYGDSTPKSDFLGISPMGRDAMSPGYQFGGNSPNKKILSPFTQNFVPDGSFGGMSPFAPQQQGFQLQPQQYNNMYMKRMGGNTSVAMQGQDEFGGYDQDGNFEGEFDGNGPREKKKPIILDESTQRFTGRLKFFDENKKYGFIVMDDDGSDIFVHFDDLCRASVTKEMLRTVRTGNVLRFNFGLMDYIGKYNRSRKAIDIQLEAN